MSVLIRITSSEFDVSSIEGVLKDRSGLHARLATGAEKFVKARGSVTAANEHKTATRLGASPTGHLAAAYKAIESTSSEEGALLMVPGNTRLRAAFGPYTITPSGGRTYLTIPVAAESYGRTAGEFNDLFFMRVGPKKTPVLAKREAGEKDGGLNARPGQRRSSGRRGMAQVMFLLVKSVNIPEDEGLIPFDDLADKARIDAEEYLDEQIERSLR